MSDFGKALFDLLPVHSALQNKDNPGRKVIDNTVGEWFDRHDINRFYDNLFLDTATGGYLDLFGRDYGIGRRLNESDDDYRLRIIQEKNDNLTPVYLEQLYGVKLYSYVESFNAHNNMLTSDNAYINQSHYMAEATDDNKRLLSKKFILDTTLLWLNDGALNLIYDVDGNYVLVDYLGVFTASSLNSFFEDENFIKSVELYNLQGTGGQKLFESCARLESVVLSAPNMTSGYSVFKDCVNLVEVDVDLPNVEHCGIMFRGCSKLETIKANLPSLTDFTNMFYQSPKIKYLNVNIPESKVSSFETYVLGLNLHYLTTFIVNGEEVDLS